MSTPQQTPAERLAGKIAERLVKDALLDQTRAAKFSAALAAGKLRTSDWRLYLEAVQDAQSSTPARGK